MKFLKRKKVQLPESWHSLVYEDKGSEMKKYRQLNFQDRIYIEVMKYERKSLRFMAARLGFHVSTIVRELKRGNTSKYNDFCWGYRADLSEGRRRKACAKRGRRPKLTGELLQSVLETLNLEWSPEQISAHLRGEVSYETIYRYLKRDREAGGNLYLKLRHGHRRRKKRFSVPRVRVDLVNKKSIEDRPAVINRRERIGDWERDLMFGDSRSSALLTIVDRKTLYTIIRKVESKSPEEIRRHTVEALSKVRCKSITNDNGFEFRAHEQESKDLGVPIYFTHPYSSWEKGTNENTNGLIRQYFKRSTSMKEFTNEDAKKIEDKLNSRPRKKLGFRTPTQAFYCRKDAVNL